MWGPAPAGRAGCSPLPVPPPPQPSFLSLQNPAAHQQISELCGGPRQLQLHRHCHQGLGSAPLHSLGPRFQGKHTCQSSGPITPEQRAAAAQQQTPSSLARKWAKALGRQLGQHRQETVLSVASHRGCAQLSQGHCQSGPRTKPAAKVTSTCRKGNLATVLAGV